MKLAYLFVVATAFAGQSFNIMTIRSGTQFQFQNVFQSDNKVFVGSGTSINFILNDDGTLCDPDSQKWLDIDDSGLWIFSDNSLGGFSINNGHLMHNSKDSFMVCPDDDHVEVDSSNPNGVGIIMKVVNQNSCDDWMHPQTMVTSGIIPGKQFTLFAVGNNFNNVPIMKVDAHPHVFSVGGTDGSGLVVSFQSDKTSLVDLTGRGVNLDPSTGELGSVAPFGRAPATPGFTIPNFDLAFQNSQGWRACPSGVNQFSLALSQCVGGTDIVLKVKYV